MRNRLFNNPQGALITLFLLFFLSGQVQADEVVLEKRVVELEARVDKLERLLDERFADDRWKDGILWSRIRAGMSEEDIRKLLGKPARKEKAIFTTWYYHKTSKDHAYVWFDEGKVLGWEGLQQDQRPPRRLKP